MNIYRHAYWAPSTRGSTRHSSNPILLAGVEDVVRIGQHREGIEGWGNVIVVVEVKYSSRSNTCWDWSHDFPAPHLQGENVYHLERLSPAFHTLNCTSSSGSTCRQHGGVLWYTLYMVLKVYIIVAT